MTYLTFFAGTVNNIIKEVFRELLSFGAPVDCILIVVNFVFLTLHDGPDGLADVGLIGVIVDHSGAFPVDEPN